MQHFAILDNTTFTFLLRLRTYNAFWFEALVRCAKKNPRLAKHCLQETVKTLTQGGLDISNVNPFQICRAANCGLLEQGLFDLNIKLPKWSDYLKIKEEQMLTTHKPKS
jgi:hypothetical protein